jgi:hypothetical protein
MSTFAFDQIAELPACVFVLPGSDGHTERGADLGVPGVVVLRDRFLIVDHVQFVLKAAP